MTLTLSGVGKVFGRGAHKVTAVRALDLDVQAGEIVALLGSSGCGKTSTLRMVAGFESVTKGTITLAGRRIERLAPAARNVAMAFEGYALYPPLTVAQNIAFGLARGHAEAAHRVRAMAELLEITDLLDRRPGGLSGGQQQRTSLARALARDADLHLLDEPMGQLEPQLRAVLRGRVKAEIKARGLTAVLVTHDQTEANAMADRIAVMEAGVLQQFGPAETLREDPVNLFVATFLGEPPMNVLDATLAAPGLRVDAGGENAAIALSAQPSASPGGRVTFGVRPQHLTLGEGDLVGTVVSNQWLGDQAHVALEWAGKIWVGVTHRRVPARVGVRLPFGFQAADIHLFDAATGRSLRRGPRPP